MRDHILTARSLLVLVAAAGMGIPAIAQPAAPAKQPADKAPAATQPAKPADASHGALTPVPRDKEEWWVKRHEACVARAKQAAEKGDVGVIFLGDSITQGWEGSGKEAWNKHFAAYNPMNLGFSGDRTQHVLWRLDHGEVDGLAKPLSGSAPKLVVMMIGTNNSNGNDNTAEEIADGMKAIVTSLRAKLPETKILMLAIFPRGDKPNPQREKNAKASELASKLADGKMVYYMDIGKAFLEKDGTMSKEVMPDFLHPHEKGYEIWASAIDPRLKELAGK